MASRPSRAPRIVARLALGLVVLLVGIWLGGHPGWLPSSVRGTFEGNSNGQFVNQVLDMLSRDYYRPINRSQLVNQGLTAAIKSLNDPYSHYYDPSAYQSFLDQDNPHLNGIGVDVNNEPAWLAVI
jgi:carboxyl-terminal processing protease